MDLFLIGANIAIMLVILVVLNRMAKKHVSFSKRVFVGLGIGIVFGTALQMIYGASHPVVAESTNWFGIVGNGYVALLKMIVMPLVMVSIVSAINNLSSTKGLGKLAGTIIGVLMFTTLIAGSLGILSANLFHLDANSIQAGQSEADRAAYLEENLANVEEMSIPQKVVEFIPTNPFADMTGARSTSTIAVVIFSAFVGVAALQIKKKKKEEAELFTKVVNAAYAVVMRMVTLILRMTPYGVAALMTATIAKTDVKGILNLGTFVLASYTAILLMFVVHLVLLTIFGLNPAMYLKKAWTTLVFAFSSRTSAGAIPMNIEAQTQKMGVSEKVANFAATFGATIGQNGCAGIYPAMLAVMIAPTVNIDPLSPSFIVQLVIIVMISSFGVAGVGGGATFAALIVLSSMNLPVGLAGLLISIEPMIDMGRTALNVSGSMTAGLCSAKLLGEIDMNVYNDGDVPVREV